MNFTVEDMLALDVFSDATLLAGNFGLSNQVKSVTIIEDLTIEEWLKGGEVLVTSLTPFGEMPHKEIALFLRDIAVHKQIAAIIIKVGKFVSEVPQEIIAMGQENNLPIIQIPREKPYLDIVYPSFAEIINRQYRKLLYFKKLHGEFRKLSLQNVSITEIIEKLSSLIGNPVAVTDESYCTLWSTQDMPESIELERLAALKNEKRTNHEQEHFKYLLANENGNTVVKTFAVADMAENKAYVCVVEANKKVGEMDYIAIETACTNIALKITTEYLLHKTEEKFLSDVVNDLLLGGDLKEGNLLSRCSIAGINLTCAYLVAVVYFEELPQDKTNGKAVKKDIVKHFMKGFKGLYSLRENHAVLLLEQPDQNTIVKKCVEAVRNEFGKLKKYAYENYNLRFSAGIGSRVDSYRSLNVSYNNAVHAHELGKEIFGANVVVSFEELGIYKLLHDFGDNDKLKEYIPHEIGILMEYDQRKNSNLLGTLESFLANNQHLGDTAQALYVHPKTVTYRLGKIKELTEIELTDAEAAMQLNVGFRILKFIRSE